MTSAALSTLLVDPILRQQREDGSSCTEGGRYTDIPLAVAIMHKVSEKEE